MVKEAKKFAYVICTLVLSAPMLGMVKTLPELPIAARKNMMPELLQLLQSGTDVNVRTKDGFSALHWAANNGHKKIVNLLLAFNADVNAETKNGEKPWQLAEENGHDVVARMLKMLGSDQRTDPCDSNAISKELAGSVSVAELKQESSVASQESSNSRSQIISVDECAICCEELQLSDKTVVRISANCQHLLHEACRKELMHNNKVNKSCPLCRSPIAEFIQLLNSSPDIREAQSSQVEEKKGSPLPSAPPEENLGVTAVTSVSKSSIQENVGRPSLFWLVLHGNESEVENFLDKGLEDINARDIHGTTALHLATEHEKVEIVRCLLARTADCNLADMGGRTPLHLAAEKGNQAIVEILLKQCADYNAKDGLGKTPLHWAFQGNYGGVIKTLLSVGADSTIRDFSGKLAGDCASNPEVKNILGGNQVIGRVRSESMEKSAHLMVLQVPVPHDPKINLRDGDGFTQLCRAAMNGHKKEVEALILLGADIDEVDTKERRTPLGWAVEKNYMDVMELLIAKGANINVADRHEETPLIAASGKGHREAVAVLLAHNADFRIRKKSGLTALSYAVFHGQIGIVEVFINHGVDLVKEENLALHDAVGAWRISDLHCKKIVELLISKGLDINAVNRDGCTLLHRWAGSYDSCNEQVLELLLAYGLDINRGDNIGNTPLHETVRGGGHGSGTKKKIELLIRHGANVNKINNGGNAPLHIAVQWDSSMTMKIVELLIKNGADAKMKNKEGKLPIECAKGELVREVLKKHTDTCVVC